jgi:phosphatidylglycerophosphate synthase
VRLLLPLDDPEVRERALARAGGIPVLRRIVRLAERAGFQDIQVLVAGPAEAVGPSLIGTRAVLRGIPDALRGPAVLLSPVFVPDGDWLRAECAARGEPALGTVPSGEVVAVCLGPHELERGTGATWQPTEISRSLDEDATRREARGDFVRDDAEREHFERRLFASLVKDTEGFMSRHVERPLSLSVSRRLADTRVTPNQMTAVSMAVGLLGAVCFAVPGRGWAVAGALLFLAHSILDGCDGELARLRLQESRWGGVLDYWSDNVVHAAVFLGIGVGWASAIGAAWPLLLSASAILGTVVAATLVFRHAMGPRDEGAPLYTSVSPASGPSTLVRIADALSRRDFIWLVVILAALGWIRIFLVLGAVGAPAYAAAILVIRAREGRGPC